jgi:hypothetical protein
LGEAISFSSTASQARNFWSVWRHEPEASKTWDRKSQKVREGGKEPVVGAHSKLGG